MGPYVGLGAVPKLVPLLLMQGSVAAFAWSGRVQVTDGDV
jgi:hypothetical protein